MKRLCAILTLMLGIGCATIVNGNKQEIPISTKPPGATVIVDLVPQGKTPIVVNLKRKQSHIVRIEREGYKPYETVLDRDASDWLWGNIILCCGLIGIGFDSMTGGFYALDPEEIYLVLEQTNDPTSVPSEE